MFNKNKWIGRKFKCEQTGVVIELTEDMVYRGAFIGIGNGAIDLGDGYYSRWIGNISEIKEEE